MRTKQTWEIQDPQTRARIDALCAELDDAVRGYREALWRLHHPWEAGLLDMAGGQP